MKPYPFCTVAEGYFLLELLLFAFRGWSCPAFITGAGSERQGRGGPQLKGNAGLSKPPLLQYQEVERGRFVLLPPFFFASVGLCGLGCEGNGWLSPRRRSLGPSRFRVVFPAGGRMVEVSPVLWNKVLWPFLRLVVIRSDAGDGLVRLGFVGFEDQVGAPDLGGPCTGVRLLSSLVLLLSS